MDQHHILENLSTHLKNSIARAISLATSMKHAKVSLIHLLLALQEEQGSIAADILTKFNLDKQCLLFFLSKKPLADLPRKSATLEAIIPELDAPSKQTLERAMLLAYEREHSYIGTEHLLHSIFCSKDRDIAAILENLKISRKKLIDQIEIVLNSTTHFPDIDEISETFEQIQSIVEQQSALPLPGMSDAPISHIKKGNLQKKIKQPPTALEIFTVELTNKRRQQNIDPVIGREKEIERLINILCRRTKNNPVLIGEPGVGKTAIIEGLAKKIVEKEVPDILKRKRLFSLDLTLLISGTIYRGEFEARLKQLIDEFTAQSDYILYIDELHNIIGAGSNSGAMDAANILKPALARGQIHCIGATTIDEYKKYISNDPALERRFQAIQVGEPSIDETIQILEGVKKYYEDFHNTAITKDAIDAAVILSSKYIHDYFLPDKAIDLIDEAASSVRVSQKNNPDAQKIYSLEDDLQECQEKKEGAIHEERFDDAMRYKEKEEIILKKLQKKRDGLQNRQKIKSERSRVTKKDVAKILGSKIQIDPAILLADEWEKLKTLPDRIKKRIVGQDSVVEQVAQALRQAQLGINKSKRPLASLLFAGPSGVGKTELAKVLAIELYFDPKALIKLDMSEFSEAHGVSKLLGSPAGYVGYKERNKFLETIHSRPYCVVLFDEFDKAHPDVRKLLFQILDDGELTDSAGKKISFQHAVIILTSNLGAELYKSSGIGFDNNQNKTTAGAKKDLKELIISKLKEEFGSALLGRIKSICIFEPLTPAHTIQIIKNHIEQMRTELEKNKNFSVAPDMKALKALANEIYDQDTGIRNMEHVVERVLYNLIISELQGQTIKKEYKLTKQKHAYKLV